VHPPRGVGVITVQLRSKRPDEWVKAKVGHRAKAEDTTLLVRDACRVYKPNGDLLCVYLPGAISHEAAELAYPFLHDARDVVTQNRGMFGGLGRGRRLRQDGVLSNTSMSPPVRSAVAGNLDRYPRFPYCRQSALSTHRPTEWGTSMPMLEEAASLFAQHVPQRYADQLAAAKRTHPAFVIPNTPFTTVTINNTVAGGYHVDAGDFKPGFGVMSVLRQGRYTGGVLTMAAYGIGIDMQDRDVVLFDVHEIHGNTPIVGEGPECLPEDGGHERISIVHYFREKMVDCLSPAQELERAKALRGSLDPGPEEDAFPEVEATA
jgi:hypothetical protein